MADLPDFIPFDQVIDDITPAQSGGLPDFIPNEMVIDDLPRTWGDTFSDAKKALIQGTRGAVNLFRPLFPAQAGVLDFLSQAEGPPELRKASNAEKIAIKGVETAPYAAYGGGLIPAIAAGSTGEYFKQLGLPEWLGNLVGGVAGGKATKTVSNFFSGAGENAAVLENRALGITKGDLATSARREGLDAFDYVKRPDGTFDKIAVEHPTTRLENALETTKADGLPKNGDEPAQVYVTAKTKQAELGKQIGGLISQADEKFAGIPLEPSYENAQRYIDIRARKVDKPKLQKILDEFKSAMQSEGPVPPSVWQNEKVLLGDKAYAAGSEFVKPFDEALGNDLRSMIEGVVDDATGKPGELGALNALHGSYQEIEKVLRAAASKGNLPDPTGFFSNLSRTTGGGMGGAIAGTLVGGPGSLAGGVGTLAGFGLSAGSRAMQGPTARRALSKVLKAASSLEESTPGLFKYLGAGESPLFAPSTIIPGQGLFQGMGPSAEAGGDNGIRQMPPGLSSKLQQLNSGGLQGESGQQLSQSQIQGESPQAASRSPDQRNQIHGLTIPYADSPLGGDPSQKKRGPLTPSSFKRMSLFSPLGGVMPDESNFKQVEALIDQDPYDSAVYETESGRDPAAKNPKSSASGGFQLTNATAKALGVSDPFNLAQSYEGFQKLKAEIDTVADGDPFLRYAGHYLGTPLLRKWLEGSSLSANEEKQIRDLKTAAMPRFKRIYQRILAEKAGGLTQV